MRMQCLGSDQLLARFDAACASTQYHPANKTQTHVEQLTITCYSFIFLFINPLSSEPFGNFVNLVKIQLSEFI
jgi:hypothetical protein